MKQEEGQRTETSREEQYGQEGWKCFYFCGGKRSGKNSLKESRKKEQFNLLN